ncbi:astacin-like metalloendopeptidase isoform X1 [Clavelina lepadiformis]|uniref:astacin-like metalloendopeptidase isoform X1 n=1 Tax=Clavelina lepadiformis TaxID=159417 RepID=UPI004042F3EE
MKSIALGVLLILTSVSSGLPVKQGPARKEIKGAMGAILQTNRDQGYEYFQGDIVLTNREPGQNKNAILDESLKWGINIPYVIHSQYSFEIRDLIEDVLREYSARLCVNFVHRENEASYILYTRDNGCFSSVGQIGGVQTISIGSGCEQRGVIIHETMHAMGFWHEQSRYDRDDYVEIKWENIQSGKEHNFDKYTEYEIQTLGEAYDYSSIMHYYDTAFSANGEPTIVALYPGGENMGQREGFSTSDLNKLRKLYNCDFIDGWTRWTDWSECNKECRMYRRRFCEGDSCATDSEVEWSDCNKFCIVGTDKDCNLPFVAGGYGTISSPLFPYSYKADVECVQTIIAPPGEIVKLQFEFLEIEDYQGICYYDWLKIYDGRDTASPQIGTFCGSKTPSAIYSTSNTLTVNFFSDYSVTMGGFLADYYSSITAPIHVCHFEGGYEVCGWTHDADADFNWALNRGSTVSDYTGPAVDKTTGTAKGQYLYIETSSPQTNGMKARIMTPELAVPDKVHCLEFSYNMFGENIDRLNVYKQPTDGCKSLIYTDYGDHGNSDWITVKIPIYELNPYQIIFEGGRGNGYKGDMAIDEVLVHPNMCEDDKEEGIEGSGIVIGREDKASFSV